MPKQKTLRKLIDDVAVQLQKLVRLKAADQNGYCTCVTCGNKHHYKKCDGGHYVSRVHQRTKIIEENIHPQCKHCNMVDDIFIKRKYEEFMLDMYGKEFVEWLEQQAHIPHDYARPDLEDQLKDLRKRNRELEAQL